MMRKDDKRDYILRQIINNNYELAYLIKKQVKVLEEYHSDVVGEVHKQNYIDAYEDMLDLVGITVDNIPKWRDDEVDRKS